MKKGLIRKGLVFGVIVLFISVGVQPVFAEEFITTTSDSEEDCNCNVKFSNIPESIEKYEELSNVIDLTNPDDDRPICEILLDLMTRIDNLANYYANLAYTYPEDSFLFKLFMLLGESVFSMIYYPFFLGWLIDCWGIPEVNIS